MSSFAAYGRLEKAIADVEASGDDGIVIPEAFREPRAQLMYLRWLFGRKLLEDPAVTTPAGNLRHGVLEQLAGQPRPASRTGKRHKQAILSPELLRELAAIQLRIEILSGTGRSSSAGPLDIGSVYVVLFSSGVVKVGKAVDPEARVKDHLYHATIHGVSVADAIAFAEHPHHSRTERELINFCKAQGKRIAVGAEYFADIDFDAACDFANEATGKRLREAGLAA